MACGKPCGKTRLPRISKRATFVTFQELDETCEIMRVTTELVIDVGREDDAGASEPANPMPSGAVQLPLVFGVNAEVGCGAACAGAASEERTRNSFRGGEGR